MKAEDDKWILVGIRIQMIFLKRDSLVLPH